ncbi:hypothetical protein ROSA5918_11045 [Roseateles saccharophilus]|uniref:Uncharacterized protein n=2 Tax=Roseateles saccharophilus TaxID=304 RepID=A0A4V2VPZ5_ROSSA|nr:hypothetical protein EV671_102273 [Roseateles saccharophilus]
MDSSETAPPPDAGRGPEIARLITDLDAVLQAMLKAMPMSKPWQRQVLTHLAEVDKHVQVLRMTIAMHRGREEMLEAVARVQTNLRAANLYVLGGRADIDTKTAVYIAFELGRKLGAAFAA